jgi:hypothetical protein
LCNRPEKLSAKSEADFRMVSLFAYAGTAANGYGLGAC